MKIFINPGHFIGADPGACGYGLQEAQVAMNIDKRVENYLKAAGFTTRVFSYDGLSEIVDAANSWDADVFVSIHCNAANGSIEGTKLANAIQAKILSFVPQTVNRGVKTRGFYVIKYADAPAVLIETAFIDNLFDSQLLKKHEDDFAKAIAEGIMIYTGFSQMPAPDVVDTPVDNFDIDKIAVLARKYESNGDPACVSNNYGDLGGISYGLYQFSSKTGTVNNFIQWLRLYPDKAFANYGEVLYANTINTDAFINQWKKLGNVDPGNFGRLQDEFIKSQFYDFAAKKLANNHFHIDKHSTALKAVLLSRAVQNGVNGCVKLFQIACTKLGHPNLSYVDDSHFDKDLINSIYDYLIVECDLSEPDSTGIWRSPDDFCHGSRSIILSLRSRFIRERADALELLSGNFDI